MKRICLFFLVLFPVSMDLASFSQGAWNPTGADLSFPRTLLDSTSVPEIRETLTKPGILSLYRSVWENANSPFPAGNTTDGERITRATIAKEAAFTVLMERKYNNGIIDPMSLSERDSLISKSRWLLENLNPDVGYQEGWVFYQEWQNRSKELINYLLAFDLLRGAGISSGDLTMARDSLIKFTANLYRRAMATYTVLIFQFKFFTFQFNNHSIMTASALGLAAIIFNDVENPDPGYQPQNWINTGMWNLDNTLWIENGTYPRVSDGDTLAGYAEGPGYFNYAFQNAFPFIRAMGNFLPNQDYPFTFNQVTRQIPNPWFDPRYDRLYDWMNRIRMPDGSLPAIHDSPVGFGTTITSLSGKPDYNWPNPSFSFDDPWIRTQYIATNVAEGSISDSLFQSLPAAGSLIFRSGWDTNATYMHFIGKHGVALSGAKSHHQGDATSFSLFAFGRLLAVDPGYPGAPESDVVNKATDHNLVLVNGSGPNPPTGEMVNTATNTAYIEHGFDTPLLDYGEVRAFYYGTDITRKNLFVRDEYFLLTDFIDGFTPYDYTFQLHGNGLDGADPFSASGSFQPEFGNYRGIYTRDSVKLLAQVLAENGADSYSYAPDSLAIGYSSYRQYSKMLVTRNAVDSMIFLTTLIPFISPTPEITAITGINGVTATKIDMNEHQDLIFAQRNRNYRTIPAAASGFSESFGGNGKINFISFESTFPEMAFLGSGDSLCYGMQPFITSDHPMNIVVERPSPLLIQGYVSEAGVVGLYSEQALKVSQGNISFITYDPASKVSRMTVTAPGNFRLEPSNGIDQLGNAASLLVQVRPNPSTDGRFECLVMMNESINALFCISDGTGKTFLSFTRKLSEGLNTIHFSIGEVPAGEYILTLKINNNPLRHKIIKSR